MSARWHIPLCSAQCFILQERFIPCASVKPEPLPRQAGNTNPGPQLSCWEGAWQQCPSFRTTVCLLLALCHPSARPAQSPGTWHEAGERSKCPVPCSSHHGNWLQLIPLQKNCTSSLKDGKLCLWMLGIPATFCRRLDNLGAVDLSVAFPLRSVVFPTRCLGAGCASLRHQSLSCTVAGTW